MLRSSTRAARKSYYQTFVDSLNKSVETRRMYLWSLRNYCEWLGVTDPNQLITKELQVSGEATNLLEDQIIEFINYMKDERGLSYSAIHGRLAAIYHFYTINRVRLNKDFIAKFKPTNKRIRQDKAYTIEQIRRMHDKANERDKVIVLLMASVGVRIGAIPTIRIGDMSKVHPPGYSPDAYIYKIIVYPREPEEYYAFCTFETTNAIDKYLEYRQDNGEVLVSDAPLIRKHFHSGINYQDGIRRVNNAKYKDVKLIRIVDKSLNNVIDRIIQRAGLRIVRTKDEHGLHEVMSSHGFRKFCITQMVKAKLEYNIREFLVGHRRTTGLDRHYDRTDESDRLKEYVKAMELLTISRENKLLRQVQEQESTITERLARKDKQIDALELAMNQYRKEVQALLSNPAAVQRMKDEVIPRKEKSTGSVK